MFAGKCVDVDKCPSSPNGLTFFNQCIRIFKPVGICCPDNSNTFPNMQPFFQFFQPNFQTSNFPPANQQFSGFPNWQIQFFSWPQGQGQEQGQIQGQGQGQWQEQGNQPQVPP